MESGEVSTTFLVAAAVGGTVAGARFAVLVLGHAFGSSTALCAGLGYFAGRLSWVILDLRYKDPEG